MLNKINKVIDISLHMIAGASFMLAGLMLYAGDVKETLSFVVAGIISLAFAEWDITPKKDTD